MKNMIAGEREAAVVAGAGAGPPARVVLVTADGGSIDVTDVAGDLLRLVRTAAQGATAATPVPPCPSTWAALCKHLGRCDGRCAASVGTPHAHAAANGTGRLTGRESQVVAHVRQGFSNKEIARRLGIQEDTVKKHLQAAFGKLGVRRRALVALSAASAA